MTDSPYSKFANCNLILRDELAIDRTLLANERTLLAYLRSAVALVIAGLTVMHFAQTGWFLALGIICLPIGVGTGIIGIIRFLRIKRSIDKVRAQITSKT